jgi:DNA gyrase inhibitor GyrI
LPVAIILIFKLVLASVKENAIKLVNELKVLLKNANLLNNKHYEINIFEHDLKKTTKKNILYKVVISSKGDKLDNKKLKNFLLNLPNNNLAIS